MTDQELVVKRRNVVGNFLERGILINHEKLNVLSSTSLDFLSEHIIPGLANIKENNLTLAPNLIGEAEKHGHNLPKMLSEIFVDIKIDTQPTDFFKGVKLKKLCQENNTKKKEVGDFVSYFRNKYAQLSKILMNRQELQGLVSINRLLTKKDKERASFIGMVSDTRVTKNGHLLLTLEDLSGEINILITKTKTELFNLGKDVLRDEVIGVYGAVGDKIVFVENLYLPDVPLNREFKKSPDEAYVIFISDLHIGSKKFLSQGFEKFLSWLNGETGSEEHKEIVKKVKYLFVVGDLIDGVGIYPGQEDHLLIREVKGQYDEAARFLSRVPSNITIILSPGNHDAMRIAEPQPTLSKEYAKNLWNMPNVMMVTNPAVVNIHASDNFPGFDVLVYHGYSLTFYGDQVDSLRTSGKNVSDRAIHSMKYLLQRRHLAPTHTSTLYIPDIEKDNLVIDSVPDIFVCGHIHKAAVMNYKNVQLICSSCWQAKTDFQEKMGHEPDPCRVPLLNLQTRQVKMLNFE